MSELDARTPGFPTEGITLDSDDLTLSYLTRARIPASGSISDNNCPDDNDD